MFGLNLGGPGTNPLSTAHVMAQTIQKTKSLTSQKMPKTPSGIPNSYRKYQTHKIKAPIRLRGKAGRGSLPKGLSNPYQEA